MWNRQRLKRNARVLLKANYLKVVVVGLTLSFLIGSGYNSARGAAKSNDVDIDVTDLFSGNLAFIVAMLIGIAGVIAIALLFNVVLNIFLWNPLEVGCRKVFVDCRYGNAEWRDILYAFKNGYGHIGAVMFMKDLFTFLWTLLFIIPGIIKGYEYMMIPYLLAENPDMSRQDAFAESKRMMVATRWMPLYWICHLSAGLFWVPLHLILSIFSIQHRIWNWLMQSCIIH